MNTPNVSQKPIDVNSPERIARQTKAAHKAVARGRVTDYGYYAHVIGSQGDTHTVFLKSDEGPASCDCKDYKHLGALNLDYKCYHILAVEINRFIEKELLEAELYFAWEAEAMREAAEQAEDYANIDFSAPASLYAFLDGDELAAAAHAITYNIAAGLGNDADVTALIEIHQLQRAA